MAKVGRRPLIAKQTGGRAKGKESLVKLGMTAAEIDACMCLLTRLVGFCGCQCCIQ